MTEAEISPLARRLAEENNVDWRKLSGSGTDGKVVERDVLEYLARVMSGQEDVDPTPEPLPEGMEEWPEEDIAAYRRGARERAEAGGADPDPAPPEPEVEEAEIDEDIFLFEDDDVDDSTGHDPFADSADVFAVSGDEAVEDDDLFLDLPTEDDEPEASAPTAPPAFEDDDASDARTMERDLGAMSFDFDEPDTTEAGRDRGARADVRNLDFVGGRAAEPEPPSARADVPHAQRETEQPQEAEETEADAFVTRSQQQAPDARAHVPLVSYGHLFRRHLDLTALKNAQAALGGELGMDEPLPMAAFLARAAGKALRAHPLRAGGVALATVEGGLAFHDLGDPTTGSFRSLLERASAPPTAVDLPEDTALVVVDLSELEVDEAVLDAGAPVLALGRVLYDDEAGDVRGTLSLSGDLAPDVGGHLLAAVADLLAAPVRLLI